MVSTDYDAERIANYIVWYDSYSGLYDRELTTEEFESEVETVMDSFSDPVAVRHLVDDFEDKVLWGPDDPEMKRVAKEVYAYVRRLQKGFLRQGQLKAAVPNRKPKFGRR